MGMSKEVFNLCSEYSLLKRKKSLVFKELVKKLGDEGVDVSSIRVEDFEITNNPSGMEVKPGLFVDSFYTCDGVEDSGIAYYKVDRFDSAYIKIYYSCD